MTVTICIVRGISTLRDRIGTITQRLKEIVKFASNGAKTISIVVPSNAGMITVPGGRMENVK